MDMLFITIVLLIIFITYLLHELGIFPLYSYLDEDNTLTIRRYFFWKEKLDLSKVVRLSMSEMYLGDNWLPVIQAWTDSRAVIIRHIGVFTYKSNLKLLKKLQQLYPKIDMDTKKLQEYIKYENNRKGLVISQHFSGYFILTTLFCLTVLFFVFSIL
jgi:hypothetical protein